MWPVGLWWLRALSKSYEDWGWLRRDKFDPMVTMYLVLVGVLMTDSFFVAARVSGVNDQFISSFMKSHFFKLRYRVWEGCMSIEMEDWA